MNRSASLFIVGALLIASGTASAQRSGGVLPGGNHSDAGGPGGGGGNHSDNGGPGGGGGNHSDNGGPGGNAPSGDIAVTPAVIASVAAAEQRVLADLHSGNAAVVQTSADGSSMIAATSNIARLIDGTADAAVVAQVTNALSRSGAPAALIARLIQSVQGLGTAPAGAGPAGAPARIMVAGIEFNSFVQASSSDFLSSPVPEFLVLRAALSPLVSALRSGSTAD